MKIETNEPKIAEVTFMVTMDEYEVERLLEDLRNAMDAGGLYASTSALKGYLEEIQGRFQ